MGFVLEKMGGRQPASIDKLHECEMVLKRFHALGLLHGDVNRYNFLVGKDNVKIVDFEHTVEGATAELQAQELATLRSELNEQSGRGGGFLPAVDGE